MPFWTAVDGVTSDPKRVSRFRVSIPSLNNDSFVWYAKSFTKPSAEITTTTHRYLNHHFNYPGSVKWGDVTVELVDPAEPIDAGGSLAQLLEAMGYQVPDKASTGFTTISKRKATVSLGLNLVTVEELNDEGEPLETWTLQQAFVSKFEWGSLKYDGDDLNVLKLTLKYDWATCQIQSGPLTDADLVKSAITEDTIPEKPFFTKS